MLTAFVSLCAQFLAVLRTCLLANCDCCKFGVLLLCFVLVLVRVILVSDSVVFTGENKDDSSNHI